MRRVQARVRFLAPAVEHDAGQAYRDGHQPEGDFDATAERRRRTQPERADAIAQVLPKRCTWVSMTCAIVTPAFSASAMN